MSKEFKTDEAGKILAKSIIKSVKKALAAGKHPVDDVLDSNFRSEANPKDIPAPKESVMNKSKPKKLQAFLDKRKVKKKNSNL